MKQFKTYKELNKEINKRGYNNILGLKAEITEEDYFYFLEVLPPIYTKDHNKDESFLLSEFLTHAEKGAVTLKFWKENKKYYCEVVYVCDYVSQKQLINAGMI